MSDYSEELRWIWSQPNSRPLGELHQAAQIAKGQATLQIRIQFLLREGGYQAPSDNNAATLQPWAKIFWLAGKIFELCFSR